MAPPKSNSQSNTGVPQYPPSGQHNNFLQHQDGPTLINGGHTPGQVAAPLPTGQWQVATSKGTATRPLTLDAASYSNIPGTPRQPYPVLVSNSVPLSGATYSAAVLNKQYSQR